MTPEQYIDQQVMAFHKTCEDMKFQANWNYSLDNIQTLDDARDKAIEELWPEGTPKEIGDAAAIMWGSVFSKIIKEHYVSRWGIDPNSSTPIVIVKCGENGMQVRALIVGAQSFNTGQLFTDTWTELKKELDSAGAELA